MSVNKSSDDIDSIYSHKAAAMTLATLYDCGHFKPYYLTNGKIADNIQFMKYVERRFIESHAEIHGILAYKVGVNMVQKNIQLNNMDKKGEHMSSRLVQLACQFESSISLAADDRKLNAKSLMGVLSFPFKEGMQLSITADGADETEAADAIVSYLQ